MRKNEVEKLVVEVLTEIQRTSGRDVPPIDGKTRPIGELPGFDSLSGLEATTELARRLHLELPLDFRPFVSEDGRQASTVREVVDRVCEAINEGATTNG